MSFSRSSTRARAAFEAIGFDLEPIFGEINGARVDALVEALVKGEGLPPDLTREALLRGGLPRIRPVLVVLAARAQAAGQSLEPQVAVEAATMAELLHAAIWLHDAALGRPQGRRRRAALRVLHGVGANHLTLRALELARVLPAPGLMGEVLDTWRELADARPAFGRECSASDALAHVEARSGTMFSFACRVGGRLAGADLTELSGLSRYGRNMGVAWQLTSELASFESVELRRELVRDASAGRPLYPFAWASERDAEVTRLGAALAQRFAPSLADELAGRMQAAGGLQASREAAVTAAWHARRALHDLPDSPARQDLDRLARSLGRLAA